MQHESRPVSLGSELSNIRLQLEQLIKGQAALEYSMGKVLDGVYPKGSAESINYSIDEKKPFVAKMGILQPQQSIAEVKTADEALTNDEGALVQAGIGGYYCGRLLGTAEIPGSDGVCGPNFGPQCASCARFQKDQESERGVRPKQLLPLPSTLVSALPPGISQKNPSASAPTRGDGTTSSIEGETNASMAQLVFTRRRNRLKKIIDVSENESMLLSRKASREKKMNFLRRVRARNAEDLEMILDAWVSVVISLNAIFLGISADYQEETGWNVWLVIDLIFGFLFWTELFLKLTLCGFRNHFLGGDRIANCFDFTLVLLDTLQLVYLMTASKESIKALEESSMPSASLFRVVRLLRLARILRVLRSDAFGDLLSMVSG